MKQERGTAFYIYESPIDKKYPGVASKIRQQMKVFSQYWDIRKATVDYSDCSKLAKRLFLWTALYRWDALQITAANPEFVYIRKSFCDASMLRWLKELKQSVGNCKIIMELPTYPYDREQFRSPVQYPIFLKDRHYRNRLHAFVDRITTYSEDAEIFGIKTIRLQNGIDVQALPVIEPRPEDQELHMIAVATLQEYHGYERVIEGIYRYYKQGGKRTVRFYIVGEGEAKAKLTALTEQYRLSDRVIFPGRKTGSELTEIFQTADIGMDCFGSYKRNVSLSSSLKTREYLARGLPVISGCRQDIFEQSPCVWHLEFPNDSTPVDIQKVFDFYDSLFRGREKKAVFSEIRKYAERNAAMEKTLAPVIQYLREA